MNDGPLLSICIATYNRADFIVDTLDSIFSQPSDNFEVVVLDGGSTDNTESLLIAYSGRRENFKYKRLDKPGGVDRDFDIAMTEAKGKYCWLLSDDDPLVPGSLNIVLSELTKSDLGLLIINASVYDVDLRKKIEDRRIKIDHDVQIPSGDMDLLLTTVGNYFTFIGCVIIRRSIWNERDRVSYFGTEFIHIGVIFQQKITLEMKVISKPLIRIRLGNAQWSVRAFEIFGIKWPTLIWGFDYLSDKTKKNIADPDIKENHVFQIIQRAKGGYNLNIYKKYISSAGAAKVIAYLIAITPVVIINYLVTLLFLINREKYALSLYELNIVRNRYLQKRNV